MASKNVLTITRFGNPILRKVAQTLSVDEINSKATKQLVAAIRHTNQVKEYGVGLAAPQVGVGIALSVIGIKPTPSRPDLKVFDQVIINPIYEGIGRRTTMWEGCQSSGRGKDTLYGKALRWQKIRATWYDENAVFHTEVLNGFVAHVFQHETDHLSGVLFVDKVKDTKTFMLADEYQKRVVNVQKNSP